MQKALGKKPDMTAIDRTIKSKDGPRRMKKLADVHRTVRGRAIADNRRDV
jgi:hypothetical protein